MAEGNTNFAYCYDAFGRRIAQWDAESADTLMGRRYIWDGWSTIQERIFSNYLQETEPESEEWIEMVPTEASAHSKAERVYVNGASIDEPLFVAIDGDLDGYIGEEDPSNFTSVNLPEFEKPEDTPQRVTGRHDFAYYYLNNRMGSITALLARNLEATEPLELSEEAHESARILEYYRYSAYGSVTVLPAHDDGAAKSLVDTGGGTGVYHASDDDMGSGSRKAWDRVEDTPLDLADNNSIMLLRREADGTYSHLSARADYGRVSQFGNSFTFTARRQDAHTGLMYYRYRMYEPVTGRFVGRDPRFQPISNLYSMSLNSPVPLKDFSGLAPVNSASIVPTWLMETNSYLVYANPVHIGISATQLALHSFGFYAEVALAVGLGGNAGQNAQIPWDPRVGAETVASTVKAGTLSMALVTQDTVEGDLEGWIAFGLTHVKVFNEGNGIGHYVTELGMDNGNPKVAEALGRAGFGLAQTFDAITFSGHGNGVGVMLGKNGNERIGWRVGDDLANAQIKKLAEWIMQGFGVTSTLNFASCSGIKPSSTLAIDDVQKLATDAKIRICWCSGEMFSSPIRCVGNWVCVKP